MQCNAPKVLWCRRKCSPGAEYRICACCGQQEWQRSMRSSVEWCWAQLRPISCPENGGGEQSSTDLLCMQEFAMKEHHVFYNFKRSLKEVQRKMQFENSASSPFKHLHSVNYPGTEVLCINIHDKQNPTSPKHFSHSVPGIPARKLHAMYSSARSRNDVKFIAWFILQTLFTRN